MIRHRKDPPTSFDTESGILIRSEDRKPSAPELIDLKVTTVCHADCAFCAVSGTPILTPEGEVPNENIEVGNRVYSYDESADRRVEIEVAAKYSRKYTGPIIRIELESGSILKLTPEHRVYVIGKGWIEAQFLSFDDDILEF